jgi:hypothetical protein
MRRLRAPTLPAVALLLLASAAPGIASPSTRPTPAPAPISLLSFTAGDPADWERLQRTSDARPLSLADLEKLRAAGVGEQTLLEMMRTRRVKAAATADTLAALKKSGATDELVAALSAYALPENRGIDLAIHLDVSTPYSVRGAPYVYIEVWNPGLDRQEAFLWADVRGLLRKGGLRVSKQTDDSDPLLGNTVRSLHISGPVRIRAHGRMELRVVVSPKAGIRTMAEVPKDYQTQVRTFTFDLPQVSEDNACRLDLTLGRDPLLQTVFPIARSDLRCYWE